MSSAKRKAYIAEKRVALDTSGKRLGTLGKEDVAHKTFSFEVKFRKKLPASLKDWYAQAVKNCPLGKHPAVILKEKNTRWNDAFVIIRYKNFLSLLKKKTKEE